MNVYSILVNSFDKFEDCWEPFFRLFSVYWPGYNGKIYLNTNTRHFTSDQGNIISTRVSLHENKRDPAALPWSECLIRALDMIDENIVLYMQEDYFLKDPVKDNLVSHFALLMANNPEVHCIQLTDQAVDAEKPSDRYDHLWIVPRKHPYRISCQAALWRKDILLQYLRPYESAWQFEYWGSKRAALLNHNFFVVDPNWVKKDIFEIIPYIFTGVVRGKWLEEVIPVFEKHSITIDYSVRGIFRPRKYSLTEKIQKRISRIPVGIRSSLDLAGLRFKKPWINPGSEYSYENEKVQK